MIPGPPARWIAPSTPPPPANRLLAALTMASVVWRVISPVTSSSMHGPIDTCIESPPCAIIPDFDSRLLSAAGGGLARWTASLFPTLALVSMLPSTVECDTIHWGRCQRDKRDQKVRYWIWHRRLGTMRRCEHQNVQY